jgi:transposase-like protein
MTKIKKQLNQVRHFSVEFRKHIVKQIESGHLTVSQAQREVGLNWPTSIYQWIYKYSRYLHKGAIMVVEKDSEHKKSELLRSENKELQAALGRKQMEIDAMKKLIELASKELDIDLKKNFGDKPLKS